MKLFDMVSGIIDRYRSVSLARKLCSNKSALKNPPEATDVGMSPKYASEKGDPITSFKRLYANTSSIDEQKSSFGEKFFIGNDLIDMRSLTVKKNAIHDIVSNSSEVHHA